MPGPKPSARTTPRPLATALAGVALVLCAVPALAEISRDTVVAHVGSSTVTAGELQNRLDAVPRFQLRVFGNDANTVRRTFLDQIIVPEVLYALAAHDRHIDQQLQVSQALARAQSNATLRAVRAQVGASSSIPGEEIVRYYQDHGSLYDTPERYNLSRILTKTREEASAVLDAAKKDLTPQSFGALAREHSLDKATSLRGGNLGFVGPDGTSNEAGLKVEPEVVKAARTVKDGELVPAPVAEGPFFAVVWRRGTTAPTHKKLEEVAPQIRETLHKEKLESVQKQLTDELRARDVKEVNEGLLAQIDISPTDGTIAPRRRPGQVPPLGAPSSAK